MIVQAYMSLHLSPMHSILQVILEHLPFVSVQILACAFDTSRVLVDGCPVQPSHTLRLGQTWEIVFHRHETEVRVHRCAYVVLLMTGAQVLVPMTIVMFSSLSCKPGRY